jgi:hypothetical protein
VGSIDEVSPATTTIDAPLSDAVIVAVSRLVDDHGQRRDRSQSDITFLIKCVGREDGDLTTPAGKERRVRAVLSCALEYDQDAGQRLVRQLISTLRASGGFRPDSPNYVGSDEITNAQQTFQQAAEALGVSISTIDRRLVPAVDTVKVPWDQRLIPVEALEQFLREHIEPGRPHPPPRPAGRPPSLPDSVVARIRLEHEGGRSLGEIARALNIDGIPTAHGGRRWWPSTVRAVLLRTPLTS